MRKCIYFAMFFLVFFSFSYSAFVQQDSNGTFSLTAKGNQEGFSYVNNIKINTQREAILLSGTTLAGYFVSAPIMPSSFTKRTSVSLTTTLPSKTQVLTTLLDCTDTPLTGYIDRTELSFSIDDLLATNIP